VRSFSLVVLAMLAASCQAVVVFTQPPRDAGGINLSSFFDPEGMNGDTYTYESFTLGYNYSITEIRWRGGDSFNGASGPQPVSDFRISVYPSSTTVNQPDVTQPPLVQYMVGGNAGEAPAGTFGGTPMYDYHFALPTPFAAAAGVKYWVQIEAYQTVYPNGWGVATGTGGDGTHFEAVYGGVPPGGTLYRVRPNDLALTLIAIDVPIYSIVATAQPPEGGLVSGAGSYQDGVSVALTATPNAGYAFVDWTENGVSVCSSHTYGFTASADRSLVANFVPVCAVSTIASPPYAGTTTGDGSYTVGNPVTVTAVPSAGFEFVQWTENGIPLSASSSYSFTGSVDISLVAEFRLLPRCVAFDFDTAQPSVSPQIDITPFDQTALGLTASFVALPPNENSFSIQRDITSGFVMPHMYSNYLMCATIPDSILEIRLSQPVTSLRLTFATMEVTVTDPSTPVEMSAFLDSNPVGSAVEQGVYGSDSLPVGTFSLTPASPFNVVRLGIVPGSGTALGFLVDNIVVTTATSLPYTLEDVAVALESIAGLRAAGTDAVARWDVESSGLSAGVVDLLDVQRLVRKVGGTDPNP
jgi:hypothetical protein